LKERIAGAGKTVILATHNLNEAEQLCDRLAIMDHGHLKALGSVPELRAIFQTQDSCEMQVKNLTGDVLRELERIDGITDIDHTEQTDGLSRLKIMITNRSKVLPTIMKIMVNGNIEIHDCQVKALSLEEIFVNALHSDNIEGND
jgi:ABC-2 type transport system ATP-binding protein